MLLRIPNSLIISVEPLRIALFRGSCCILSGIVLFLVLIAIIVFTVQPIYTVSKILSPFIKLLSVSTNAFLHLIGMKTEDLEEAVSEEEIKALLEM